MAQNVSGSPNPGYFNSLCLGIAVLLLLLAPGSDSLWIDEANSANMALQPDLTSWWQAVNQIGSDVQMSLYFFQLWAWEKLFGSSEWALRLNNLPWIFLGLGAWFLALPRAYKGPFALVTGLSPFLWYYANEIRPYSMLFGATCLMFASLTRCVIAGINRRRMIGFALGGLMAMGASSAALPWVGIALLFFVGLFFQQKPDRSLIGTALVLAIPAAGIGALYVWSFSQGARPSSPEPSTLASLLFVPYELLGFVGIGPGRAELRGGGIGTIRPYLPQILLLAGSLSLVIGTAVAALKEQLGSKRFLGIIVLSMIPMIAVAILGMMSGLRTTGRHFTPALALILPVTAIGLQILKSKLCGQATVVVLCLCLIYSSFQIRTAARHKKDNYREAARLARASLESGNSLWWAADRCGAVYYGVPISELPQASGSGVARIIRNLDQIPKELPEVVVLSRPEVYDNPRTITKMLQDSHFQLKGSIQGFTIWEKPATP